MLLFPLLFKEATGVVEEEKAKVRAVLRRIFPDVVVDDALVSTILEGRIKYSSSWVRLRDLEQNKTG